MSYMTEQERIDFNRRLENTYFNALKVWLAYEKHDVPKRAKRWKTMCQGIYDDYIIAFREHPDDFELKMPTHLTPWEKDRS